MVSGNFLRRLLAGGLHTLTPAEALTGWQMANGRTQTIIAKVDWPRFLTVYQVRGQRTFLQNFIEAGSVVTNLAETPRPRGPEELALPLRRSKLEEIVRQSLGQILRMDPKEIDPGVGFFDLGMD